MLRLNILIAINRAIKCIYFAINCD